MKESVTVIEIGNSPFDIDCQSCYNRYSLESMTLMEDSKILCKNCIVDTRLQKLINCSKNYFMNN